MAQTGQSTLDRNRVRQVFEHAIGSGAGNPVTRYSARELSSRLELVRIAPQSVLDLGCGAGTDLGSLAARYPGAKVYGLDTMAGPGIRGLRKSSEAEPLIAGLAELLPFMDESFDLIYSNLVLSWCELIPFAVEVRRVLRPQGLLMFSTLGPDTLCELRRAWAAVDDMPHVHDFPDMHNIGDVLLQAGFADPVMDAASLTVTYRHIDDLFADLKSWGFTNAHESRRRTLTGRQRFQAFRHGVESGRTVDRLFEMTYELVYGHAWAPAAGGRVEVGMPS